MARPNVKSNYTGSPATAPTSASQRVLAIIGEGSIAFTTTEKVTRFSPPPPTAPAVAVEGTGGAVTWTYAVTSVTVAGESTESAAATTATGNATLSVSNYNHITWAAVPGATSYNVYRTVAGTSPATTGLIGNTTGLFLDDKALTAGAAFAGSKDAFLHDPLSITRIGNYQTTVDYAPSTDYVANATGVTWLLSHGPVAGAAYWVTYTYAKTSFAPGYFTDYNSILSQCGPITSTITAGALDPASQLTMAAKVAMAPGIGASQLILAQINPATPGSPTLSDFQTALLALQNPVSGVKPYYVVPLIGNLSDSDAASVNAACLAHCIQMADPQFLSERRCYTGMKNDATYSSLIAELQALGAANSSRITVAANFDPTLSIVSNGVSSKITLDGSFVAVALAAYRSTQQVSQPELNVLVTAFDGFNTTFNPVQIDTIDDNGGMVLENVSGVISTVNDVTVNVSSDIEKSIPTVETRDDLIIGIRLQLKRTVLGKRGSPTIPSQIEDQVDKYLTSRLGMGDIMAFSPASAKLNSGSTTKYTVTFSYMPAGEVLGITVSFSIDLNLA